MPGIYHGLLGLKTPLNPTHNLHLQTSHWLAQQLERPSLTPVSVPPVLPFNGTCMELRSTAKRQRLPDIAEKHIFFDVETNGLSKVCLALQLSFLVTEIRRNQQGKTEVVITDFFDGCFNVPNIAPQAAKIHGITLENLKTMQAAGELHEWSTLAPRFLDHCQKADAMVGHNVAFDIRSIGATLAFHNLGTASTTFNTLAAQKKQCTLQMSRSWTKDNGGVDKTDPSLPNSNKLTDLYHFIFKANIEQAHDAAADTLATAALYYFLKSEGIDAASSLPKTAKPKLSEPAEIYNSPLNSIPFLVMEHDHDRRHIIPKSLLRLLVQHGITHFGAQAVAKACVSHPQFTALTATSLNPAAQAQLKALEKSAHQANLAETENLIYILLKHQRFNYFLGESTWNRAIGGPMRFLRATEAEHLLLIDACQTSTALNAVIDQVFDTVDICLSGQHPDANFNVSFEDTRGPQVQIDSTSVLAELNSSLQELRAATHFEVQDQGITTNLSQLVKAKEEVTGLIKSLQDSFAFDPSQSHIDSIRQEQNSVLAKLYGDIHGALQSANLTVFTQTLQDFLSVSDHFVTQGFISQAQLYNQENPIYAARQLNSLITSSG